MTKLLAVAVLGFASLTATAEIKLPGVLADHMVLQRDQPVHLWGTAAPGEKVRGEFRGHKAEASADAGGKWSLTLPKGDAGGPFTLTLAGSNTITFSDVLVGDVWLASGQSNMELTLIGKASLPTAVDLNKEIADSVNFPQIRLFHVTPDYADAPAHDVTVQKAWSAPTTASVKEFSAVAWFFAKDIQVDRKIPIGIIDDSLGSSPAEAWISHEAFAADPSLMAQIPAATLKVQNDLVTKAAGVHQKLGAKVEKQIFFLPSYLYNAMIAPLIGFPIKGVIWYQGEANSNVAARAVAYQHVFSSLITDWRSKWHEGDFPFLYVQLAGFTTKADWPDLRESQRRVLDLPNTGMAVAIDTGESDTIHPRDKWDVGYRLALWARAKTYGEKIEYTGPLFDKATPEGGKIVVHFTHAEGLVAKGGTVTGFEVAGADGKFVPAEASIAGTTVVASAASVAAPMFVRYEWTPYPDPPAPLYNSANLPASPFSSKWP